jgi:hypothetical protein
MWLDSPLTANHVSRTKLSQSCRSKTSTAAIATNDAATPASSALCPSSPRHCPRGTGQWRFGLHSQPNHRAGGSRGGGRIGQPNNWPQPFTTKADRSSVVHVLPRQRARRPAWTDWQMGGGPEGDSPQSQLCSPRPSNLHLCMKFSGTDLHILCLPPAELHLPPHHLSLGTRRSIDGCRDRICPSV